MIGVVLMSVVLAFSGATALWASLFLTAVILLLALRFKLVAEQKRVRELENQVDFAVRQRRIAMELFHSLGSAFESGVSLENLLRSTVAFFMRIAQATGGVLYLTDRKEAKQLHPTAMCGTLGGMGGRARSDIELAATGNPLGKNIIGEVALSGRPVFMNDRTVDSRFDFLGGETVTVENAMAVPLRFRDESLGVLVVINRMGEDGNVGKPFGRFEFQLLESMAVYAATAIHLTLSYLEQSEKQRLDFDLEVASEIQKLLLPQRPPVLEGVEIAGRSQAAYLVGGDHYDFIPLDKSKFGVTIADVSGKGVTGALVMAICHAIVRTQAGLFSHPLEAVKKVRRLLLEDIPEDRFITMIYGILDADRQAFTFVRAGHDPLLCYRAQTGSVETFSPKGGAIGLDRGERFDRNLEEQTLKLSPGDAVILFTDGLTEMLNLSGEEFGLERLTRMISQNGNQSADDLMATIFQEVEQFSKGAPALDDQTLVVIKLC